MAQYSIKELEHLSGIKAHTIRIWEQRYGILSPKRTDTNIRYYEDADLKSLLNISLLNENGYKISKIAKMSFNQISDEVVNLCVPEYQHPQIMNRLLLAMIEMDEEKFDRTLSTVILQQGFEKTMLQIIYPFLNRIGILWQTGNISPAQEHFVSNIIRQKLIVAIDGQSIPKPEKSTRFLLYLPEGELHELGLLFLNYILRVRENHVMYLGQNLPFVDFEMAAECYKPHVICTVFTVLPAHEQLQEYINKLSVSAGEASIFISGLQVQSETLIFPENITRLTNTLEFLDFVDKLGS